MSWTAGLGSHALSWIFLCSLEISRCPSDLQSCVPPWGLLLSSLRAWHEICAFLLVFGWTVSCQVTALPPSPFLVWICRHTPRPSFRVSHSRVAHGVSFPFVPCCCGEGAGSPLCLGLKASLYQLSRCEHNRIGKLFGPVGWSGFPWPSRPHIVCDVAGCFSLLTLAWRSSRFSRSPSGSGRRFLSRTGFWGGASRSILWKPGCPGYRSVSSLLKTLAVALVLKAGSWRKHTTFLLNYMRVLVRRSLETFHLGFVVPAFGPGFHLGRLPGHTCPSWTHDWRLTPLSFLRPSIGAHWDSLVQRLVFTTYVSISPPGVFGLHCSAIQFHYRVSLPLSLLDLLLIYALSTVLPGLSSRVGGEQAPFHVAWHLPPLGLLAPDDFTQVLWQSTGRSPPS